jgi:hypothetical protein
MIRHIDIADDLGAIRRDVRIRKEHPEIFVSAFVGGENSWAARQTGAGHDRADQELPPRNGWQMNWHEKLLPSARQSHKQICWN